MGILGLVLVTEIQCSEGGLQELEPTGDWTTGQQGTEHICQPLNHVFRPKPGGESSSRRKADTTALATQESEGVRGPGGRESWSTARGDKHLIAQGRNPLTPMEISTIQLSDQYATSQAAGYNLEGTMSGNPALDDKIPGVTWSSRVSQQSV